MPPRFFVPDLDASQPIAILPAEEAAHLARVLRLKPGADVRVFDGLGHEWRAEVTEARPQHAAVRLIESVRPAPELAVSISLVVAVLKGDKMDDVIRDAVMLGAAAIQPVLSTRTEIAGSVITRSGRVDRWQRIAISSAKQCGRAVVPPVQQAVTFGEWLASTPSPGHARLMLVEPGACARPQRLRDLAAPDAVSLVIGPEGGWTHEEVDAGRDAGLVAVGLGGRTLRADAVPIVALAMCQGLWEQ